MIELGRTSWYAIGRDRAFLGSDNLHDVWLENAIAVLGLLH